MLKRHELNEIAARAYLRLPEADRALIAWDMIPGVVDAYAEKRNRITDVGEAIRITLRSFVRIRDASQDAFTAWARLLRKVEYEVGFEVGEKRFAPFSKSEILRALAHLRQDARFAHLVPPDDNPRVEFYMFKRIGRSTASRRMPASKLVFLTGTVIREEIGDVDKATAELQAAYKSGSAFIYHERKRHQTERRARGEVGEAVPQTEHPESPPPQLRLV